MGRSMEIDPLYVDLIIRRFETETGENAVLMETGQTRQELGAPRTQATAGAETCSPDKVRGKLACLARLLPPFNRSGSSRSIPAKRAHIARSSGIALWRFAAAGGSARRRSRRAGPRRAFCKGRRSAGSPPSTSTWPRCTPISRPRSRRSSLRAQRPSGAAALNWRARRLLVVGEPDLGPRAALPTRCHRRGGLRQGRRRQLG